MSDLTPLVRKRLESAPRFSRWHVAAFFLIGIAAALPPTSFIAPKRYFLYKFRTVVHPNNTHPNATYPNMTTMIPNGNHTQRLNQLQKQYESLATIVLSVAIVLFNLITVFIASKIRLMTRLIVPFCGVLVLLILSLALTKVNTDTHQLGFFIITMMTIFIMTGFSIIAFASIFGFASVLPPQFLVSVLAGTAFGSVIVGVLNVLTLLITSDPQDSALIFFGTAVFIVGASIAVIVVTFRSGVIMFYVRTLRSSKRPDLAPSAEGEDVYNFDRTAAQRTSSIINVISNKQIIYYVMKKTWLLQLNGFLFHVSFGACFPALASAIEPMQKYEGELWSDVLFVPVVCFLLAYTAQFIGRVLPRVKQIPSFQHWRWITLITVLRFAFIPLYFFCNVQPRNPNIPILFTSDVWAGFFNVLWGFSTGYFGSLITLYLPKLVTGELKENASIVAVTFTAVGQAVGGAFSILLLNIIDNHKNL